MQQTTNEIARVQKHIADAEAWIAQRDVHRLSPQQQQRRLDLRRSLDFYRARGVFPVNPDFAEPTPYFVDAGGTPCAMAHLMLSTGHDGLVERVATTNNNARIADLAHDHELLAWLTTHGLTVEEAARIQPSYGPVDKSPASFVCEGVSSAEHVSVVEDMIREASIPVEIALVRITSARNQENEIRVRIEKTFGDSTLKAGPVMTLYYESPVVTQVGAVFLARVYPISKEVAEASPVPNASLIVAVRQGHLQGVLAAIPTLENGDVGCHPFPSGLAARRKLSLTRSKTILLKNVKPASQRQTRNGAKKA